MKMKGAKTQKLEIDKIILYGNSKVLNKHTYQSVFRTLSEELLLLLGLSEL